VDELRTLPGTASEHPTKFILKVDANANKEIAARSRIQSVPIGRFLVAPKSLSPMRLVAPIIDVNCGLEEL
jgi:thioredoxin-like negative regulator of GroEL